MSCLSSARFGLLLAGMISAGLSAATLSPADQNAIEQQQKALLEQTQQQRDMLRYSTPAPSLPETPPPEAAGPCFELRYIQLENVTALPLSAQRKLIRLPAEGQILNLRDTEQGLEQLNRLNSRSLTVDILPGSREGFSRVELVPVSQRFPVSLDVGADKEQILPDGRLMYAKINDNQTINLREFSASAEKTGARWTIDIIGNPDIKAASKTSLNRFEVKFR
ncbi:TPA: POTRA domain-containing protein [Klebsiella quasipneumoniae]